MRRVGQGLLCRLTRRVAWCLGCAVLVVGSSAFAEKPAKPTLVVAPLKARGTSAQDAAVLGDMLRSRIINIGSYQVVTPEEMQAIDAELQRQLSGGCDEASCISELAGALGAQFLITGSLDRIGSQTVVTLKMIEIERVRAIGSVMARAPNIDGILTQIETMLGKLFKVKWRVEPGTTKPSSEKLATKEKSAKAATTNAQPTKKKAQTKRMVALRTLGQTASPLDYSEFAPALGFRFGRPSDWAFVCEFGHSGTADGLAGLGVGVGRQIFQPRKDLALVLDGLLGPYFLDPSGYGGVHLGKIRLSAVLGDRWPLSAGTALYVDTDFDVQFGIDLSAGIRW